ncbi:hypothetical protein D3C74_382540 [compost metagenome]
MLEGCYGRNGLDPARLEVHFYHHLHLTCGQIKGDLLGFGSCHNAHHVVRRWRRYLQDASAINCKRDYARAARAQCPPRWSINLQVGCNADTPGCVGTYTGDGTKPDE